jgi:hypothetical protein
MKAKHTILTLTLLASSCSTAPAYVQADQLTYNAIAPEYKAYCLADPQLTQMQKDRRLLTLATWLKRIQAAAPR